MRATADNTNGEQKWDVTRDAIIDAINDDGYLTESIEEIHAGLGDDLSPLDAFARFDDRLCGHTDMLPKGHDVILAERHTLNRQVRSLLLVVSRVYSMLETAAQQAKCFHDRQLFFFDASCSRRLRIRCAVSCWKLARRPAIRASYSPRTASSSAAWPSSRTPWT